VVGAEEKGGGNRVVCKHSREDNIKKYPRNSMRRMDYPEFYLEEP
jgi:hypothetical protein